MIFGGRMIAEIAQRDIYDLLTNKAPEDAFTDFKRVLFPSIPSEAEKEKNDLALDFVAFANAQGGYILVGIDEDEQHCAKELVPMDGYNAQEVAKRGRDIAIARVAPPIRLEIQPFKISENEWIVIAHVPESPVKPHMWLHQDHMRFVIRDNDRKRTMAYDEIKELLLKGPHEQQMARFLTEIRSLRSLVEELSSKLEQGGES